jgi:oligopeptide/dipeptide ABC transporter ATP-binding protein
MQPLLDIAGLTVGFVTENGTTEVLRDVSLQVMPGEIFGIVGESGSGKSVTALAVMRLLGEQGRILSGRIALEGTDLLALEPGAMRAVRGRRIGMVFQEPMTSLNPLLTVGFQIAEVLSAHLELSGHEARKRGIALLEEVGIPDARSRYDDFPHQFSGGMRQRVMIAMAMACTPRLLIADEPTTALDVTIQAQILSLMRHVQRERGSSILLISHDIGVIAQMSDRIAVMYAGQVVEVAPTRDFIAGPAHPYSRLLMQAMPTTRTRRSRLPVIPGQMPAAGSIGAGCRFRERCPVALPVCATDMPALTARSAHRLARCWRDPHELMGMVA